MAVSDLLLSPRGPKHARLLVCGARAREPEPGQTGDYVLAGTQGLEPFTALGQVLADLKHGERSAAGLAQLVQAERDILRVRSAGQALQSQTSLHGAAMASRGTLAALRRITRESAEVSIVTDRAARAIVAALSRKNVRRVIVPNVEHIDRPSLKAIARSCLLAAGSNMPTWEWRLGAALPKNDKPDDTAIAPRSLFSETRADFVRTICAILNLEAPISEAVQPIQSQLPPKARTIGAACAWLSVQNYDACFLWAAETLRSECSPSIDALRFLAMAATNTGRHDLALRAFNAAYHAADRPTLRAQLAYMQGLLFAKRKLDMASSRAWYEQGLRELERFGADDEGDRAIEEAWIYNGLALNALLETRLKHRPLHSVFQATFDLLRRAFTLVQEGRSSDRVYLRHNLLSNMSSFMELEGKYKVALDLVESAFAPELAKGLPDEREWLAMMATRRAGLYVKAGDFATAERLYRDAIGWLAEADRPICVQILRRSLGTLALMCGRPGDAEMEFRCGLGEALAARSAEGAKVHGTGLVTSLIAQGRDNAAIEVIRELGEAESLWLCEPKADPSRVFSSLTPPLHLYGLSTDIPEIDLEECSSVSVRRVLQRTQEVAQSHDAVPA